AIRYILGKPVGASLVWVRPEEERGTGDRLGNDWGTQPSRCALKCFGHCSCYSTHGEAVPRRCRKEAAEDDDDEGRLAASRRLPGRRPRAVLSRVRGGSRGPADRGGQGRVRTLPGSRAMPGLCPGQWAG